MRSPVPVPILATTPQVKIQVSVAGALANAVEGDERPPPIGAAGLPHDGLASKRSA